MESKNYVKFLIVLFSKEISQMYLGNCFLFQNWRVWIGISNV